MKRLPPKSTAILAAAGSRKTEHIIDSALAVDRGRVLITTYTHENQRQIISRLERKCGSIPPNIHVMGWFTFLIQQCSKPYQRALTGKPLVINGLNFEGRRFEFAAKRNISYFLDKENRMYRDGVSDFVVQLNSKTNGAVVRRLEKIFSHIFIDEVQDFVGYDLDVLEVLLESSITVTMVGDPRQHLISTNLGPRNKQFRGTAIMEWFKTRAHICCIEHRSDNYRSNQAICDFADQLYPDLPKTASVGVGQTGHDGIFQIETRLIHEYVARHGPVATLRHDKNTDTCGLPAMNIGLSKGSTFDRVLIFPTEPMKQYLRNGDVSRLKAPAKLYVAVTRAKYSVIFALPTLLTGSRIPVIHHV